MKRAGWYLVAGAAAGFAGVLGFHGGGTPGAVALGQPKTGGTGAVVPYGYGELSVKVTMRNGRIAAVSVPVLRTAEPYSQQLALQVIPMLKAEVLAAHSAQIHGVSGATYTSAAYARSIQSALDKLHAR